MVQSLLILNQYCSCDGIDIETILGNHSNSLETLDQVADTCNRCFSMCNSFNKLLNVIVQ